MHFTQVPLNLSPLGFVHDVVVARFAAFTHLNTQESVLVGVLEADGKNVLPIRYLQPIRQIEWVEVALFILQMQGDGGLTTAGVVSTTARHVLIISCLNFNLRVSHQ
jgi:hypothetical protein